MLNKIEKIDKWCQSHDAIVGIVAPTIGTILLVMLGGFKQTLFAFVLG